MRRDELSPAARDELGALDRILAGEPVGQEHLELAALVESVRADVATMSPAFEARLDAAAEQRLAARPGMRLPTIRLAPIALAGGGLLAAVVALAIVISSGMLTHHTGVVPQRGAAAGSATHGSAFNVAPRAGPSPAPAATAPAVATGGSQGTNAALAPRESAAGRSRLVHRTAALELATPAGSLPRVAREVVVLTGRRGGVVASSFVDARGPASRASFSIRVPSARLAPLIADLSTLASLRALTQQTNDVTSAHDRTLTLLARRRAERAALRARLAHVLTATQAHATRHRLAALDALIAADRAATDALLREGRSAALHVVVVVGPAQKGAAGPAGGGNPLDGASRTALHALEELLAVALVALAILLPVAACVLGVWWCAASLRQRARERAMRAA